MMNSKTTTIWVAATLAALALGCDANKKEEAHNSHFKSDGDERVSKFGDVQASNGARNDAMLYPHHFTAGHLNSLGRSKVLLMLEDCESCEPTVVHLVNCGEGDVLDQRKASVELYLKTSEGPNKLTFTPVAPNLVRFAKTESGKIEDMGLPKAEATAVAPSTK
jgi:hypothetical protein